MHIIVYKWYILIPRNRFCPSDRMCSFFLSLLKYKITRFYRVDYRPMCISRLHIQSFAFQLFLKLNIMLIDITLAWMNEVIFIKNIHLVWFLNRSMMDQFCWPKIPRNLTCTFVKRFYAHLYNVFSKVLLILHQFCTKWQRCLNTFQT